MLSVGIAKLRIRIESDKQDYKLLSSLVGCNKLRRIYGKSHENGLF